MGSERAKNSGSGKTYRIQKQMIHMAARSPKKNFLFIVPEQFTMQTQRELVQMHPNHSILNIDVLSFNRLAYRIFDEHSRGKSGRAYSFEKKYHKDGIY